ncbi:hypothetical protein U5B43_02830 [Campylobacter sp. 9BO]|uniref:hypothetical protein n=1 Tax=Campylobacter sp. 9BO TaxID=3424759 RepID=UPI003D34C3D9
MPENEEALNESELQQTPSQEQVDEFDTVSDEEALKLAQEELEQSRNAIDAGFAKFMSENLSPELEELFFSDKEQFFLKVEEQKELFIEEQLGGKVKTINELNLKIRDKVQNRDIANAKKEFLKAHPDADFNAMSEFFENETTKKQREEILSLPALQGYEKVYELMGGGANSEKLPQQLEGSFTQDSGMSGLDEYIPAFRR